MAQSMAEKQWFLMATKKKRMCKYLLEPSSLCAALTILNYHEKPSGKKDLQMPKDVLSS